MHYTRNKKLTYQINSSTTDTQRVPSINIPKLSNNNSIYIQNLIERSDRFKNLGSDYKVLSSCCPKLGSSIKNIFSSDKKRNDAMNYVKKLRSNKSQIMEFTESQAQNRQNSVSRSLMKVQSDITELTLGTEAIKEHQYNLISKDQVGRSSLMITHMRMIMK